MLLTEAGMPQEELKPLLSREQSKWTDIYRIAKILTVKACLNGRTAERVGRFVHSTPSLDLLTGPDDLLFRKR
ncbi:hypothetical protein CLV84_0840 [Neolewinella xylanilytica]|uniref:Uncharacterized protein n=1 Tax=Neolewinella xylanilytica TaxID=1514080 RepID=A0A2S6I8R9_9BACT|nr:hypothetical protein CLV84_0840 [Neolewinella xylanilytica]